MREDLVESSIPLVRRERTDYINPVYWRTRIDGVKPVHARYGVVANVSVCFFVGTTAGENSSRSTDFRCRVSRCTGSRWLRDKNKTQNIRGDFCPQMGEGATLRQWNTITPNFFMEFLLTAQRTRPHLFQYAFWSVATGERAQRAHKRDIALSTTLHLRESIF